MYVYIPLFILSLSWYRYFRPVLAGRTDYCQRAVHTTPVTCLQCEGYYRLSYLQTCSGC